MSGRGSLLLAMLGPAVVTMAGCAPRAVPDPQPTVARYAEAVQRGDSKSVYVLLSRDSQRRLGQARVRQIIVDSKQELAAQTRAVVSARAETTMVATVRFVDGETATLTVDAGRFRVSSASVLPAQASTPEQALGELRAVLARRSYAGLVLVLTEEAASGLEAKLGSLALALEQPEALEIRVDGDRAVVEAPGGHRVELQREGGVWKIRNFE